MLAKRMPSIMPEMTEQEAIETTQIHSVAKLLDAREGLVMERPFRAPHHTISDVGLLGGDQSWAGRDFLSSSWGPLLR